MSGKWFKILAVVGLSAAFFAGCGDDDAKIQSAVDAGVQKAMQALTPDAALVEKIDKQGVAVAAAMDEIYKIDARFGEVEKAIEAIPTLAPTVEPTASPEATPEEESIPDWAKVLIEAFEQSQVTAVATPVAVEEDGGFDPVLFDGQSCGPDQGWCTWDVGAHGSRLDMLGRRVTQVGIVKGVDIEWNDLTDEAHGRCELVALRPDNWFEDLAIRDARVEVYDVDPADVEGWLKTLAVQAAQEQAEDYGCPTKTFEEIPQWESGISSPPGSVEGFHDGMQPATATQVTTTTVASPAPSAPTGCATVGCGERLATRDYGGVLSFAKGAGVVGYEITINGKTYNQCFFEEAPAEGRVVDGAVFPKWDEINVPACIAA